MQPYRMFTLKYKCKWVSILLMLGLLALSQGLVASMGVLLRSIRSVGMGGAGVAHPDAIGAVVNNPAGLAHPVTTTEWATHSLTPDFEGGNRTVVRLGSLGYANSSVGALPYQSVIWAYGRRGSRWLDWGIRAQQWHNGGWSTDFGVVAHVSTHFQWGAVISKWIQSQPVGPSTGQVGVAWVADNQEWVWVLDGESTPEHTWKISTGLEWQLASDWWIRGGVNASAWTAGMGVLWGPVMVDYAVQKATDLPHQHVVSIRWGGAPVVTSSELF